MIQNLTNIIKSLNIKTSLIGDKTYLLLYHGAEKEARRTILQRKTFPVGTSFAHNEKLVEDRVMKVAIDSDSLIFNDTRFIAEKDLIYHCGECGWR